MPPKQLPPLAGKGPLPPSSAKATIENVLCEPLPPIPPPGSAGHHHNDQLSPSSVVGRGGSTTVGGSLLNAVRSTALPSADAELEDDDDRPPQSVEELIARSSKYCMEYVFPPHMKVVRKALIRMAVYAKYGPAVRDPSDRQLKLRGQGRLLRAYEERLLLQEEERNMVTDTYGGNLASRAEAAQPKPVDADTEAAMNMSRHPLFHTSLELSKKELTDVLQNADYGSALKAEAARRLRMTRASSSTTPSLSAPKTAASSQHPATAGVSSVTSANAPRSAPGTISDLLSHRSVIDDTLSNALLAERRRRIRQLQRSVPTSESIRQDTDVTTRKTTRFYNHSHPKAYKFRSWADPKDVLRELHRKAFQVTEFSERNNPAINLNVRCLRGDFEPRSADRAGWDPYCCVRETQVGKANSLRTV